MDTIILAALRREPERRYITAGELAADIERHLNGRPVAMRNDSVGYRTTRFLKRNFKRMLVSAVILVLAVWAGLASWMVLHPSEKRLGQSLAQTSTEQRKIFGAAQKLQASGATAALPADLQRDELTGLRRFNADYFSGLSRSLERRPGLTPERAALVDQGEQYLNLVRSTAGNDAAVLLELARGYLALGDLKGNPRRPNLGDRAGALAMYDKAQSVLQPLKAERGAQSLLETVNEHAAAVRVTP